jgi:hypothetical protein
MAMRITLRYLGVQIHGATHLFGDNGSVVTNASIPDSPLRKRHQALAYHYTREAIAAGAVDFRHIPGEINPADILSKHWGYAQIWQMLRAVMFWTGNPSTLLVSDTPHHQQEGSEKCPVSTGSNSNPEKEGSPSQGTNLTANPEDPIVPKDTIGHHGTSHAVQPIVTDGKDAVPGGKDTLPGL